MDVEVIVETPQGSRNKYEMDAKRGRIRLNRMLFTSTRYPLDYGFVTDTLAVDGEPLDALVWLDEPTIPGCLDGTAGRGLLDARRARPRPQGPHGLLRRPADAGHP